MELQELLKELKSETAHVKTASETPKKNPNERLLKALDTAINSFEKTATAEQNKEDVSSKLLKMAEDLANSEAASIQKEAEFYGAALADGFLSRMNQYASAVSALGLNKTAADNAWNEAFQAGLEAGYQDGLVGISKTAQVPPATEMEKIAEFNQGYNDATQLLQTPGGQEKVAEFIQGYNDAAQLLKTPGGQEKVAEFIQGYSDAAQLLQTPEGQEKIGKFLQGYNDGKALLEKLGHDVAQTAYNQTINAITKAVK